MYLEIEVSVFVVEELVQVPIFELFPSLILKDLRQLLLALEDLVSVQKVVLVVEKALQQVAGSAVVLVFLDEEVDHH